MAVSGWIGIFALGSSGSTSCQSASISMLAPSGIWLLEIPRKSQASCSIGSGVLLSSHSLKASASSREPSGMMTDAFSALPTGRFVDSGITTTVPRPVISKRSMILCRISRVLGDDIISAPPLRSYLGIQPRKPKSPHQDLTR